MSHSCDSWPFGLRNWFLYKMFSIWLCSFQSTSGFTFLRSLKTIQVQEDNSHSACSSQDFLFSLTDAFASVSTWNESPSFLFDSLPRKEVIQPHLPIRLPCYDFTPVIGLTFDGWLLAVTSPASGAPNSHGVTGGVYKARERIHRGMLIRDY